MANISTAIQLYDRVSAPINKMLGAINSMIGAFDSVETAMDGAFDTVQIAEAKNQVHQAKAEMIALGSEIDDNTNSQQKFNDEVEESADSAKNLKTILGGIGLYFGLSELKEQVSSAIDFASDLTEVQNVVDVAFGKSSKIIDEWATTTLDSFGLNELSAKQFAGTLGAMLKSSGMTGDKVTEMSMKVTELAGDMASFYNLEGEEAFNKLRSGISGETEPLKALGINMSVANLEAYALSQGIKESYSEMSQAEQVMLRYNYLLQATGDAQGDFARTSDSFSNQQKLLSENWKAFTGELATNVLPILAAGIGVLNGAIGFLADNWGVISPILAGLAAAIALVNAPLIAQAGLWLWNSVLVPAYTAVVGFLQLGYGVLTGNTAAASAAQLVYNNALLACPLTWILLIIIAVIAAIYAVVAAINKATDSTISATGVIVGALMAAVAFIWNLFLGLVDLVLGIVNIFWNRFAAFANFFGNVFNDPIGSIIHLFGDMADSVLGILETIASAIDKIFGSNLAGAVQGWRSGLDDMVNKLAVEYGNGEYEEKVSKANLTAEDLGLKRWAYSDAYDTGYKWGEGIDNKISDMFGGGEDGLLQDVEETAANTEKTADALDITNEDLKYMRDIAERDVINRFTTAEIKVDMTNNNTISKGMDLDGVIDYLANGVNDAMEKAAEGVHV